MKILIDGRPLSAPPAGIANFLIGSLQALAKQSPNDVFYLAMPHELHPRLKCLKFPNNVILISKRHKFISLLPNLIWLNTCFIKFAQKVKPDFFFSALPCIPYGLPKETRKIIVAHDVVNIEYKNTMEVSNILANSLFFKRSIRTADILWTNSKYTRDKITHYFPKRKSNYIFVGCSVNRNVYKDLKLSSDEVCAIKKKYNIKNKFILFVGSLEPRKNLQFILKLIPQLYKQDNTQLVVVGGRSWKSSSLYDIINSKDFPRQSTIFCDYIRDDELAKLYNIANCFVSPSYNEGFGMPQLEAALCGCPVITSNNSAMTELAKGKVGMYAIDGYSEDNWIAAIKHAINSKIKPIQTEFSEYDWDLIAKELKNLIQNEDRN